MSRKRSSRFLHVYLPLLIILGLLSACAGQLPPVRPSTPPATAEAPQIGTPAGGTPVPAPLPLVDAELLALPAAFRYELTLRPAEAGAPATMITGQYREGAWSQTSRTEDAPDSAEELIVARNPSTSLLQSYTRAISDTTWTRWPGVTFDQAYGLASPFTVLRLRAIATQSATPGNEAPDPNAPIDTTKMQVLFSTEEVQRLLSAGVSEVARDADTRASLENQIAALFVPQTVTYWTDARGRTVQAAATLLSLGADNQPAPWVELTARYSAYDDPTIAVTPPDKFTDIADVAGRDLVAEQAADVQPGVTLRVRVFANAGAPATDAVVTAYPAGKTTVADEKLGPDAQFALKPGQYDVLVRAGGAQQWVKGVAVSDGSLASNDVLFDFAQLTVTVSLNDHTPAVDVVVYPVGEKKNFAGFVSENPAKFQLPAGMYDVEAGTQDGLARKRVTGVEVRAGLETTLPIDLGRP